MVRFYRFSGFTGFPGFRVYRFSKFPRFPGFQVQLAVRCHTEPRPGLSLSITLLPLLGYRLEPFGADWEEQCMGRGAWDMGSTVFIPRFQLLNIAWGSELQVASTPGALFGRLGRVGRHFRSPSFISRVREIRLIWPLGPRERPSGERCPTKPVFVPKWGHHLIRPSALCRGLCARHEK